jgi:glycerol uptake facilitator-like aquaporin
MLIIASTYLGAILMTGAPELMGYGVLNPAIGFMSAIVMLFTGHTTGMKWFWIYLSFPFLGALVGVFFFEIIYKKLQDSVEEVDDHKEFEGDEHEGMLDGTSKG